jgi:hypothetical protein
MAEGGSMSGITLHSAVESVRDLLDQIDSETGELPAEYEQARAIVATKATAVAAYILQTEREADMAAEYVKELQTKVKAHKRRADWLRTYLREHMAAAGITKISDERCVLTATLSVGRDKSVEVFDAAQVPAEYMRVIPATTEPDKRAIGAALEMGKEVGGARIVARDRLTIK